jgi:hypothetical protein
MGSEFNLGSYLKERKQEVETALDQSIAVVYPEKIYESMRYSLNWWGAMQRSPCQRLAPWR